MLDLELHFSKLASFVTLLFDPKIAGVGVCRIQTCHPKIKDGDFFPIHIKDMHNVFVFDGRHGVKTYLRKLKGVLM